MNRQRCPSASPKTLLWAAFALLIPSISRAVTLNIDSTGTFYKSDCGIITEVTPSLVAVPGVGNVPTGAPPHGSGAILFGCPGRGSAGTFNYGSGAPAPNNTIPCLNPFCGNISNQPNIEFEHDPENGVGNGCFDQTPLLAGVYNPGVTMMGEFPDGAATNAATNITGAVGKNYCNDSIFLCTSVGYSNETSSDVSLDEIMIELFKFQDGSNPLDPSSTPPLRTFFIDNPGTLACGGTAAGGGQAGCGDGPGGAGTCGTGTCTSVLSPKCVLWDGMTNIQGEFGKTNGTYGFRVTARTQVQSGSAGNITITAVRAYPSATSQDANLLVIPNKPITLDVTDVHLVRASGTVVGRTGVVVEPYNFTYRLSKDATMFITIDNAGTASTVRHVVNGLPRIGEGVPNGTLLSADFWNGRFDNGDLAPPGDYLATFQARNFTQFTSAISPSVVPNFPGDLSFPTTRQIALDPLQITDIAVQPLLAQSTSLAFVSFILTEPATAYLDIYPPGTQFCGSLNPVANGGAIANPLDTVNNANQDCTDGTSLPANCSCVQANAACNAFSGANGPPKTFLPRANTCAGAQDIAPVRTLSSQFASRQTVSFAWDGRDNNGSPLQDGDYVFVLYAVLPSQNGFPYNANNPGKNSDKRIWTSQAKSGFITIDRGFVGITQLTAASTVIGSSPSLAALNPFIFRYVMSRDATVSMKIFDSTGRNLVKTILDHELRPGLFSNSERWEPPVNDSGTWVSSGTYMVELDVADPLAPNKVSSTTALFPVDLYRITDIQTAPLLNGASDFANISYQLSQTMNVGLNIYPPGTVIVASTASWPPCGTITPGVCGQVLNSVGQSEAPIVTINGMKPGRRTLTESWNGRDQNGLFVPDGLYVFTLAAQSTTTPAYFASDKVIGNITVARGQVLFTSFNVNPDIPQLFNSSNTIELDPFSIEYALTRQSSVTIQILTATVPPQVVRTIIAGQVRDAGLLQTDVWDGRDDRGNFPKSGFYNVQATAQDLASVQGLASGSTSALTISFDPLRIYDLAITPLRGDTAEAKLSYQVSEPMKVSIKIYRPGTTFDASGNPSPAEALSLVKRIVGVKPSRVEINEVWDGTDLRESRVPNGTYRFKIVGSTDVTAINDINGAISPTASLAEDQPIDDIPVVRPASTDPEADMANNSFFYPNPVTGPQATIQIYVPIQADVTLKIYTMEGELVYSKDFGNWPTGSCVQDLLCTGGIVWNKVNAAGKTLGRGVYYAVIRQEETLGGRAVIQTVKKVLIP